MSSVSLFEQLTSSVSLSMVTIVASATLGLLLIYTVACRLFFSSSKSTSSNKDKKPKESNTKKQQIETTSVNKKKNVKVKKNVVPVSSSSPSSQTDESEEEKVAVVTPTKKSTPTSKKGATGSENSKTGTATNGVKTSPTKQQAVVRNENVEGSTGDNKKKQAKTGTSPTSVNTTIATNKQQTAGKGDAAAKVNTTASNKKQPIVVNSEVKPAPRVEGETGSDQEDEGQWLTQSSKQVNSRNRTKGKPEPSNTNNQLSPTALSHRNVVSEKRSASNSNTVSSTNKTELDIEPIVQSNNSFENQEPIELCQLLSTNENRYTSNDNWWKHALNKQQTFSIDDIGEWPEREEDEQYIVQVKRIIPVKHNQDDEQLDLNEQTNSSSILTADSTATTSPSKKKITKVRQLS